MYAISFVTIIGSNKLLIEESIMRIEIEVNKETKLIKVEMEILV